MKKVSAVVGWVLCIFFALLFIGSAGTGGVAAAIFALAAAILVCPLFRSRVKLPGKIWIPIVIILLFLICLFVPKSDTAPSSIESFESSESSVSSSKEVTPKSVEEGVDDQSQVKDVVEPEPEINSKLEVKTETEDENDFDSATPEYDALQEMFLSIDKTSSKEDIVSLAETAGLFYTEEQYNDGTDNMGKTVICIAYTEGSSLQKYAESGDHLDVTLDNGNNDALMYMTYNNRADLTGLYYRYGTWYKFSEEKPGNDYEGYYIDDAFGKDGGIVIKYNNGYETSTNYFPFDNKKAIIDELIMRKNEE